MHIQSYQIHNVLNEYYKCLSLSPGSNGRPHLAKQAVKDNVKKLIDDCGDGGGYLMMNGSAFDEAKAENLKAMIDTTKEYGVYK